MAENIFRELTADDLAYEMMLAREKFQHRYNTDLSEARKEGLEQGEKLGRSEGLAEGKIEMAKVMRVKNYSIEEIAELTGLPAEEIEKL